MQGKVPMCNCLFLSDGENRTKKTCAIDQDGAVKNRICDLISDTRIMFHSLGYPFRVDQRYILTIKMLDLIILRIYLHLIVMITFAMSLIKYFLKITLFTTDRIRCQITECFN